LLKAFNSHLFVLTEKTPENVAMAARKTLLSIDIQLIRGQPFPGQPLFSLLSSWLLEDLDLMAAVIRKNPKVGTLAMTNSSLRDWLADESEDDIKIMDLIRKNAILKWSID